MKFFTLPPREVPYPFILINANRPENGLAYIRENRGFVREVIIDSGVEIFRDPSVKEYPGGARAWIKHITKLFSEVSGLVKDATVYATVPDYPDDYNPGSLWTHDKTNIERTLENIKLAMSEFGEVRWLIPVQGHYRDPGSVQYALSLYAVAGVPLDDYIAIANLCVENRHEIMIRTIAVAHNWLMANGYMSTRIHVFGLDVATARKVRQYIYSFDSMAWTRPRAPGGWSAKTQKERVWLFITWLHKYADIIDLPYGVRK